MKITATARKGIAATALASVLLMSTAPANAQVPAADCDPEVATILAVVAEDRANAHVQVADAFYTEMPATGFSGLSCLENLFSGGMDILFTPPSLGDLLGMLVNYACRQAETLVAEAVAPITSAATGAINGSSLGLGEVLPGVNLGSVMGGVSIRGTNTNAVRTNLNGVLAGTTARPQDIYERPHWPVFPANSSTGSSVISESSGSSDNLPSKVTTPSGRTLYFPKHQLGGPSVGSTR